MAGYWLLMFVADILRSSSTNQQKVTGEKTEETKETTMCAPVKPEEPKSIIILRLS